jgi:hypothetical protein
MIALAIAALVGVVVGVGAAFLLFRKAVILPW